MEKDRPEMESLPCTQGSNELTETEFKNGLLKMSNNKACGPDRIPVKLYKHSEKCQQLLCELIQKIWSTEEVPVKFARATFVMLYKNKGSKNDPAKYRCIGLLCHSYKVLNQCLLHRLEQETASFLSEWQAGFRKQRGCRDNVLVLRTIYDDMLEMGEKLYVSFIDYSAAFDSVSHKFIDKALKRAGASNKSRALFRAIYNAASATTKVQSVDGSEVLSAPFPINRGVVQGDITSPLYFILALELILRKHDNISGKGIKFGDTMLDTLGYADDAALLDCDIDVATARVTSIARGSKQDADMEINASKTEVMHVMEQGRVASATTAELKAVCKFKCPHVGCPRVFHNAHGCKCHAGKCSRKDWIEVSKILDARGETGSREFLIRWKGYGAEHDLWEPRKNIHPELISEYLHANNLYDHEWPGERCPWCDKPCKNAHGVKIHMRWCDFKPDEDQNFTGTCAEKRVKQNKLQEAQKAKRKVFCDGIELENVYTFKYLGSIFSADGNETNDVKRRIALAMQRMGVLRHVFDSNISLGLKMKVYKSAICSLLTYGCEAWSLNEKTIAMLNGANARCLSRFTGKDAHTEASARTRSYDLVAAIRQRRFKWLGHILRMHEHRLVKLAVKRQHELNRAGNMFHDVPAGLTLAQIIGVAKDRARWKRLSTFIGRPTSAVKLWPAPNMSTTPPREGAITRAVARNTSIVKPSATHRSPQLTSQTTMKKYRARDAHELLLRPTNEKNAVDRWLKMKKPKRNKKPPKGLTDKQRVGEAHAHFIIHHGSRGDAMRFLNTNPRAASISATTLKKLEQMRNAPDPPATDLAATTASTPTPPPTPIPRRTSTMWAKAATLSTPPMQSNSPAPTQQQPSSSTSTTATSTLPQASNSTAVVPMFPQWATVKDLVFSSSEESSDANSDLTMTTTMQTTVESITPTSPGAPRLTASICLPPSFSLSISPIKDSILSATPSKMHPSQINDKSLSPIRRVPTRSQRTPPLSGILLLGVPSPITTTPPRILGYHTCPQQHHHNIYTPTNTHTHTLPVYQRHTHSERT